MKREREREDSKGGSYRLYIIYYDSTTSTDWGVLQRGKKGLDWGWEDSPSQSLDSGDGRDGMGCVMLLNASHNPAKQASGRKKN